MACTKWEKNWSGIPLGDLAQEKYSSYCAHLQQCEECRSAAGSDGKYLLSLRAIRYPDFAEDSLKRQRQEVWAKIDAIRSPSRDRYRAPQRWSYRLGLAAAAAVVVGIFMVRLDLDPQWGTVGVHPAVVEQRAKLLESDMELIENMDLIEVLDTLEVVDDLSLLDEMDFG